MKRYSCNLKPLLSLITITLFIASVACGEDRMAQGTKEIATGIASVPRQIAETTNDSNIINGIVVGAAKGVVGTLENVGKGMLKILTFYAKNK